MTEPPERELPAALTSKSEAFIGGLAPDEAVQLQQVVQQSAAQADVEGYSMPAEAAARGADEWTPDLPSPLTGKLRAFVGSLSSHDISQLRSLTSTKDGEVRGYTGVHTSPPNNNPTYGEFFNQLTQYVGGIVGAPFKPL